MAARAGMPIPTCDDMIGKKNEKYRESREAPKHPNTEKLKRDLVEWSEAWGDWLTQVSRSVTDVLKAADAPPEAFDAVVREFTRWGETRRSDACEFLKVLRNNSTPQQPRTLDVGTLTGSTPPPP